MCSGEECLAAFSVKKQGGGGKASSKCGCRIPSPGKEQQFISETDVKQLRVIKLQVKVYLFKPSAMAPGKLYQWKLWYLGN